MTREELKKFITKKYYKPVKPLDKKPCKQCEDLFTPYRVYHRFCSPGCRYKWNNKKK